MSRDRTHNVQHVRWLVAASAIGWCLLQAPGAAAPAYATLPLRELPQEGRLSRVDVTLAQIADRWRRSESAPATALLLYVWDASAEWRSPVQSVFVGELQSLDRQCWDERKATGLSPISIVTVYGASQTERDRVYGAIQTAMQGRTRIPTFVDVTGQLPAALSSGLHQEWLYIPALARTDARTLEITAARNDDPLAADEWVRYLERSSTRALGDVVGVPPDAETSWFRRHIARAGELMGGARLFRPKDTVTDVDFLGWLRAVSKRRVEGALTGADPRDPIRLTRERAITATIRFIYGDGPVAALEACPPPASEIALGMKSDPAELWRQAFDGLPGSSNVTPALRPYLVLAHAKGLLYAEPSLHSKWPLTREVAAWLLSHAIDAVRTDTTGIIVDAIDVPLAPDLRFGMGEICFVQDGELMTKLYPRHATSDRLPSAAPGYPWVLYVSARALADTASREAQWMTQRVGHNPMVVRARGVDGRGTLARHVVISEADAERIIATNRTTGILDNYGVAIVHGVGAQLSTARRTSGGQQECLVVRFSVAMDPATVNTGSVRLEEVTSGRRVPTKLTWQPGKPVELQVEPATRLDPGRQYALVLADTVRSAGGLPLTMAGREGLPPGVARRWALNTEHGLSAPRSQNVAWARLFAAS